MIQVPSIQGHHVKLHNPSKRGILSADDVKLVRIIIMCLLDLGAGALKRIVGVFLVCSTLFISGVPTLRSYLIAMAEDELTGLYLDDHMDGTLMCHGVS